MPQRDKKTTPSTRFPRTLAVDIGGSKIKATVLDADGPRSSTPYA